LGEDNFGIHRNGKVVTKHLDDLFATFDEDRTAHGLTALAAIGQRVQPKKCPAHLPWSNRFARAASPANEVYEADSESEARQSESSAGFSRDGWRPRETRGTHRGDPQCPDTPLALAPARIGRASIRKSPIRSSPNLRPAASHGFSLGERRQRRFLLRCRKSAATARQYSGS
jgi:hypothetical protein